MDYQLLVARKLDRVLQIQVSNTEFKNPKSPEFQPLIKLFNIEIKLNLLSFDIAIISIKTEFIKFLLRKFALKYLLSQKYSRKFIEMGQFWVKSVIKYYIVNTCN